MIYLAAANEPTLFVMFNEQDVITMRQGRTLNVDRRVLRGYAFNHLICCLNKTDAVSMEILRKAGHKVTDDMLVQPPEKTIEELTCKKCGHHYPVAGVFEDVCIICWSVMAKKSMAGNN